MTVESVRVTAYELDIGSKWSRSSLTRLGSRQFAESVTICDIGSFTTLPKYVPEIGPDSRLR